jgi:phenylalanine-4-hydroxylase
VSSKGETVYCLESLEPKRIAFDLRRVMRTRYRIDDFQPLYFVIDSFEQLFEATAPDFTPLFAWLKGQSDIEPGALVPGDREIAIGT